MIVTDTNALHTRGPEDADPEPATKKRRLAKNRQAITYRNFRTDVIKKDLTTMHDAHWEQYQQLGSAKRRAVFGKRQTRITELMRRTQGTQNLLVPTRTVKGVFFRFVKQIESVGRKSCSR